MLSWKEQVQKKFEKEVWEQKQREIAERMTDEFLKLILAELGNDFEVLVSRDRI